MPLLPHSMLRIEVMGTAAAVSRAPTAGELSRMRQLLEAAMQQGYAGFSTDAIPFHYLANAPHTDKRIPGQHATLGELKSLLDIVRGHDRVWQCTPDAANRVKTFLRFFFTSGRLFGRPLRTSALTAVDLTHERSTWKLFPAIAGLLNSRLVDGRFHFQVLATPVPHVRRRRDLSDLRGVRLVAAAHVAATSRTPPSAVASWRPTRSASYSCSEWHDAGAVSTFNRDLDALHVERCPVPRVAAARPSAPSMRRLQQFQSGERGAARSDAGDRRHSRRSRTRSDARASFLLHLIRRYDRELRWWFMVANDRPEILKQLLFHEHMLPGFNDSGAHLINLAFFDGNLLTLQIAARESRREGRARGAAADARARGVLRRGRRAARYREHRRTSC